MTRARIASRRVFVIGRAPAGAAGEMGVQAPAVLAAAVAPTVCSFVHEVAFEA